ncbi:MAG: DNA repair protein RecN [Saprospiraceae bacterium]|nr:MAG: DNA repair protein RecN [Saprospiraceae bacterium]
MINSLQIQNYAIIESLEIKFSKGLTIITGETGAGKSILLGALGLIMGERADTKTLYDPSKKMVVEAFFDIQKYALQAFFDENDIDYDSELVIRREITPSGKSRAFINDTPVNLKVLQELSGALIDLHQQFETLDIHQVSYQLRMIDALAGNKEHLLAYQQQYHQFKKVDRKLALLREQDAQSQRELEFVNFQLEEFHTAALSESEQTELEEELSRLTHAEDIKRTLSATFQGLGESELSVIDQLTEMGHSLAQVGKHDARIRQLYERFNGLIVELEDLSGEFERIADATEYDEARIVEVQERLDMIYRLEKKHAVSTIAELLAIQEQLEIQLRAIGDMGEEIERLNKERITLEKQLREKALELRRRRQDVAPQFEQQVMKMLQQLAMPNAQLKVNFEALEQLSIMGLDEVYFLFGANKGSRLQMIKNVASGGELSRLTLVTKSLVASAIPLPTLIFDEIDTGISGDVALKMGNILRSLSNQHQVTVITHSPQVASKADAHYFVYKKEKTDRTVTNVRLLSEDERVRAIATMLSQSPPSESALENARELLSLA